MDFIFQELFDLIDSCFLAFKKIVLFVIFFSFLQINTVDSMADQEVVIPSPEESRYLRIMMTELSDTASRGSFRFELNGCHVSNDAPAGILQNINSIAGLVNGHHRCGT